MKDIFVVVFVAETVDDDVAVADNAVYHILQFYYLYGIQDSLDIVLGRLVICFL
jgi:hypothetical protein